MNKLIISLFLVIGITACTRTVLIKSADDYTREIYTPRYANGFRIYSIPSDSSQLALEVYRPDTMRIAIPIGGFRSLLCMSSTYVGNLSYLGADSLIVAVSCRDYLNDTIVKNRAVEIGYEGAIDYEAILSVKPDIALIYGIGGHSSIEGRLEELSIPYVYINDFEEQNPLGRAEWMVALGALTGTDRQHCFSEIVDNYRPAEGNVSVMLNAPYSGAWFIPGRANYISRLISDAGGKICVNQQSGAESTTIDLEEAIPALAGAEIWLNPGQVSDLAAVKNLVPKAKVNAKVWNQTSDFFEYGAARPDLVLNELQQIFQGSASDSLRFFTRLK